MNVLIIYRKIRDYLSLDKDLNDYSVIHDAIVKDSIFKGTNLWILMFAIVVASVGLNMNSTAVIIGAMLISPLMGPINGMGYSIATHNYELFRVALKNFGYAVLVSLVASTAYFTLSPIGTAQSELLARTSPTIYDVFIALFGGTAGIIAISSRQKGNVIPGVAIATALMPPLCTVGYGFASGQLNFVLGAFFLFTINTVFIAISSVVASQILKFPVISSVDPLKKKNVNRLTTVIILLVLLPSIYLGYQLVQKERFSQNSVRFISNVSVFEGRYLLNSSVNADKRTINLVYGGKVLSDSEKEVLVEKAEDFNLKDARVSISQGLAFNAEDKHRTEADELRTKLTLLSLRLDEKEKELRTLVINDSLGADFLREVKSFFPQITSLAHAKPTLFTASDSTSHPVNLLFIKSTTPLKLVDKQKIKEWFKSRVQSENVEIVFD